MSYSVVSVAPKASWQSLSDVYLFSIACFLSPEEVTKASGVHARWKESLDKEAVWKKQHQIQRYAPIPIHPEIGKYLKSSAQSRFPPAILTIIAEYEAESRPINYKAEIAKPLKNVFGPADYATYFGAQVINPMPPPKIGGINSQPDSDHPEKTIGETHMWTYRPGNNLQINGERTELTMNILEQLIHNPRQGHATKFEFITSAISQEQRDASMGEEGWYLMPKTVFEGTRNLPFDRQEKIVTAKGYEIPSGPDVILATLVCHVKTGEFPFGQNPLTYTRTTSLTASRAWRWVVGGFGPRGLVVSSFFVVDSKGLCGSAGVLYWK